MAETLGADLGRAHREIDRDIALAAGGAGLAGAMAALRRHIWIEEELVFPLLDQGGMRAPLFVMRREHGEMWRSMTSLEAAVAAGAEAGCDELTGQLERHNTKEESIIYARVDELLSPADGERLRALLPGAEMPAGWTCRTA